MDKICITIDLRPQYYIDHRKAFSKNGLRIVCDCREFDSEFIEELVEQKQILHFDEKGEYIFACDELLTGYFQIDLSTLERITTNALVDLAEKLIMEQLFQIEFMIDKTSGREINYLMNNNKTI